MCRIRVQRPWNETCTRGHVSADYTDDLIAIRLWFAQDNGTAGEAVAGRSVKQPRFDSVVDCVAGNHRPLDKRTRFYGVVQAGIPTLVVDVRVAQQIHVLRGANVCRSVRFKSSAIALVV